MMKKKHAGNAKRDAHSHRHRRRLLLLRHLRRHQLRHLLRHAARSGHRAADEVERRLRTEVLPQQKERLLRVVRPQTVIAGPTGKEKRNGGNLKNMFQNAGDESPKVKNMLKNQTSE